MAKKIIPFEEFVALLKDCFMDNHPHPKTSLKFVWLVEPHEIRWVMKEEHEIECDIAEIFKACAELVPESLEVRMDVLQTRDTLPGYGHDIFVFRLFIKKSDPRKT